MLLVDQKYSWIGYGNGIGNWFSSCRLRIYEQGKHKIVLYSNKESPLDKALSNGIEHLSTLITRDFVLEPSVTRFFDAPQYYKELFSLYEITFDIEDRTLIHPALWNIPGKKYGECKWILSDPIWITIPLAEFENLIDKKIK